MTKTQRQTVEVVRKLNADNDGVCRTPDVAAELGISDGAAWDRLNRLANRGVLVKEPGSYPQTDVTVIYWDVVAGQ